MQKVMPWIKLYDKQGKEIIHISAMNIDKSKQIWGQWQTITAENGKFTHIANFITCKLNVLYNKRQDS